MRVTIFMLAAWLCSAAPLRADTSTGLVGWWPFSGDAQDASGNGNHGTPLNAVLTWDRFGTPSSAYHFNGVNARIDVPSSASLESPADSLTIAAWIRRDGWGMVGTLYNPIVTKSLSPENAFQYRLITTQSGMNLALDNWHNFYSLPFTFDEDVWYHVASTWDGDSIRHYINGGRAGAAAVTASGVSDQRTLSIGSDVPGVLEIFYGDIDDVRIYARALSDADVAELAGVTTGLLRPVAAPGGFELRPASPNPFRGSTVFAFTLPRPMALRAEVLDLAGRRVRTVSGGALFPAGAHAWTWDGRDAHGAPVPSGLYVLRLAAGASIRTTKVLRID